METSLLHDLDLAHVSVCPPRLVDNYFFIAGATVKLEGLVWEGLGRGT